MCVAGGGGAARQHGGGNQSKHSRVTNNTMDNIHELTHLRESPLAAVVPEIGSK